MKKHLSVVWLGLRGFPNVQGGVETHAQHLCPLLVESGCDVTVIVRHGYQPPEIGLHWHGVHFKSIWAPRSRSLEAIVHSFLGVLYAARVRPDILHIQAIGPSIMTPLARLLGLRVIVTHHGADYEREKWGTIAKLMLRLGEYCGMRFSNGCIVISRAIGELVRNKHEVEPACIPNGVSLPDIPDTAAVLKLFGLVPRRYVLMVGRLVPEKRHHDLIQAFAQSSLEGWKLVLVGGSDHPDAYSRSVIEGAQNAGNVVCTGFQSGDALKELYANAAAFVLPSSHEGLPISILEALSYGLSVIASDIPANREVGYSGIDYYPVGNQKRLTERLKRLADTPVETVQLERSRQFVKRKYDWDVIAESTYDLYSLVMRSGEVAQHIREFSRLAS